MFAVSPDQIRRIEQEAADRHGLSTSVLMERAGRAVASEARKLVRPLNRVTIVCGKGNNGGDGFVAARALAEAGVEVTVVALESDPAKLSAGARAAFEQVPKGVRVLAASGIGETRLAIDRASGVAETGLAIDRALTSADLVVDAILGFGLKDAVRGLAKTLIERLNGTGRPVLAVDVPSGVDAATGAVRGVCVQATITVSMIAAKTGLLVYPSAGCAGWVIVKDLGVPVELVGKHSDCRLIGAEYAAALLPRRRPEVHKKACGRVLVVAGSRGMTGAATLAAQAAIRAGAGLVTLAAPESLIPVLETKLTEVIMSPLAETPAATISTRAAEVISELSAEHDVTLLGPGISRHADIRGLVAELMQAITSPLLLDADGLNAVAGRAAALSERAAATIITPHPGELSRLLGVPAQEIQSDRLAAARRTAESLGLVVVLKGARTVIGTPSGSFINPTGNAGMASAGTGDVLAGFIASFWAQALAADVWAQALAADAPAQARPENAAVLGTYLHGLSGDLAARDLTEYCLIASDLIDFLPEALKCLGPEEKPA